MISGRSEELERGPFDVLLSDWAETFLGENVLLERTLIRIAEALQLLGAYPFAGSDYCPDYPAARPPFPCRHMHVSDTPFTLYYVVDEDARTVTVFDVEWSSGDPSMRFRNI
ncbi:MAG: hypothetical protein ACI4B6_07110 [Atopobiaceae bacterium]